MPATDSPPAGWRISGRVIVSLFIVTIINGDIAQQVTGQVHRAHDLFNELDFALGDAVFGVQVLVRPALGPVLRGHEGVNLARGVLGWLVQQNQQPSQPTAKIR